MEKYIDFNWIKKVLSSCTTYSQWHNAEKLEQIFRGKYPKEWEMFTELTSFSIEKLNEIKQ
jgi:hypothetical protein|tara:strand:- start:606 stop:788 length:183 start_codon:yes stop_codon:yes gene_type:complete